MKESRQLRPLDTPKILIFTENKWKPFSIHFEKLSLINLGAIMAGAADIPAFRSMRTLRALRPLRAVSRWEGMRVSSCRPLVHRSQSSDVVCRCNFKTPLVLLLTCDQLCQKKSFVKFWISCARVTWTKNDSLSYNFPKRSKSCFWLLSGKLFLSLPQANFFLPLLWTLNVQQFVFHSLSLDFKE